MKNLGNITANQDVVTKEWVEQNSRKSLKTVALTSGVIDLSLGDVFTITITSDTAFSVVNASQTQVFVLKITNGASATVTFPSGTKWSGGTGPSLQTSGLDVLSFLTTDGGASWIGFKSAINAS